MNFSDYLIGGVPLVVFVFALVEWAKSFNLSGNILRVISMAIGIVFGGIYKFSVSPPVDVVGWLELIVFGIAIGLVASGFWDGISSATTSTKNSTET